jgi:hypothetical protein
MKKILLILVVAITTCFAANSQERGEKIEALRIAYITKQLPLTADEAKVFWPVYDVYEGEMRKIIRDCQQKNCPQMEQDEKILNLRKKYKPDFLKVISEAKFDRLIKAESTLKDMIIKELQRRKESGGGRRGGNH